VKISLVLLVLYVVSGEGVGGGGGGVNPQKVDWWIKKSLVEQYFI